MASSRKTLDIDTLTFQTIYIKAQSTLQLSSYTIPVIPGDDTVLKQLVYLTPHQALSVGNIYITPSTLPDINSNINYLSTTQTNLEHSISTISDLIGFNIPILQSTTALYISSTQGYTYNSTYSTILAVGSNIQSQNISTLNLQNTVTTLGTALSTLSSQFSPNFSSLGYTLETTFNQGPAVSSLSTYFSQYFNGLADSIPFFSTSIGVNISTTIANDSSTLIGYNVQIAVIVAAAAGGGISSLSTVITSSFSSFNASLLSYDTRAGISSISTNVTSTLNYLSTQYNLNTGIPGICSISTSINLQNLNNIQNLQIIAGTPIISTFSTYITSNISNLQYQLEHINTGNTICTFSTMLQLEANIVYNTTSTVGYTYIILQQESVKVSISSLSTSFGHDLQNLQNLSSFSTMLPGVYSSISTYFSLTSPTASISTLSTTQLSNTSTILNYMSTIYPSIYTGPGVSSLSTTISPLFSSFSTSLFSVFSSLSNTINVGISSVRCDTGVSSLSTFFYTSTTKYSTLFNTLFNTANTLSINTAILSNTIISLSNYDSNAYFTLNPASSISSLYNNMSSLSLYVSSQINPIVSTMSYISASISTLTFTMTSSYIDVQSTSVLVLNELISSYTAISSVVETNIYSPTFSTFQTDSITTSNFTVTQRLLASSIGLNQSTTSDYVFAMSGGARFVSQTAPLINHVMVGLADTNTHTIFTNSNAQLEYSSNSTNQFTGQGNDIAYNGSMWVTVGSNSSGIGLIKYSYSPEAGWTDATYPSPNTLSQVNTVKWNGSYWLAGGSGTDTTNNLLQSTDGISWTSVNPANTMTSVNGLSWNGFHWVAVGSNTVLYTDTNGIWQVGINPFSIKGLDVTTNGRTWVAVGNGSVAIKYSYDAQNWQDVLGPQLTLANSVAWNGDKFVATGYNGNTSNIMYSYNGVNWSYAPATIDPNTYIAEEGTSVLWDGTLWKIAGLNNNTSPTVATHLISYDALQWSTIQLSVNGLVTGAVYGQAYASNTTPTIQLSNFDIYSGEVPIIMDSRKRMNIIQSTIYFNDGDLTIRHLTTTSLGNIGINTTYPEYSLDIGVGNARKPVGTTWVTPSDARVKTNIIDADLLSCAKLVSDIPLRQYTFTKEYQIKTGATSIPQYGFIAQEVQKCIPDSIRYTKEFGLDDFHSLDTDQIFKLDFGATQYLLTQVEKMEAQISTLENKIR